MSKESVQFVEMVREKFAKIAQEVKTLLRCYQCGRDTWHTFQEDGDWEIYTCEKCGYQKTYRVR